MFERNVGGRKDRTEEMVVKIGLVHEGRNIVERGSNHSNNLNGMHMVPTSIVTNTMIITKFNFYNIVSHNVHTWSVNNLVNEVGGIVKKFKKYCDGEMHRCVVRKRQTSSIERQYGK